MNSVRCGLQSAVPSGFRLNIWILEVPMIFVDKLNPNPTSSGLVFGCPWNTNTIENENAVEKESRFIPLTASYWSKSYNCGDRPGHSPPCAPRLSHFGIASLTKRNSHTEVALVLLCLTMIVAMLASVCRIYTGLGVFLMMFSLYLTQEGGRGGYIETEPQEPRYYRCRYLIESFWLCTTWRTRQ